MTLSEEKLNAPEIQNEVSASGDVIPGGSSRSRQILSLMILGLASLGLIHFTDLYLYRASKSFLPGVAWIPDARITSSLLAFGIYVLVGKIWPRYRDFLQKTDVFWVAGVSLVWLATAAIADFGFRVYLPPVHGPVRTAAFLVFGVMAEEFLFRGAIFSVAKNIGGSWFAIATSAVFFSVSHLQYHNFQLTAAAFAQMAYTLPMGVAFGFVRDRSDSLWPPMVLHFLNNGLALMR